MNLFGIIELTNGSNQVVSVNVHRVIILSNAAYSMFLFHLTSETQICEKRCASHR